MRIQWLVAVGIASLVSTAAGQEGASSRFEGLLREHRAAWQALQAEGRLSMETISALNSDLFAELDPASLDVAQIEALARQRALVGVDDLGPIRRTLSEASVDRSVEGARALLVLARIGGADSGAAAPVRLLEHPGAMELLRSESGGTVMQALASVVPALTAEERALVYAYIERVPDDASDATLSMSRLVVSALADALDESAAEAQERGVRRLRRVAEMRLKESSDPTAVAGLERLIAFLDGAYALGRLIGSPMPEMEIVWSSDPTLTTLEAMRGKVVVLDFWATWCGPCIAGFPEIRRLQDVYAGHEVVVIGVTSVQGGVYNLARGPVDCEGDATREHELTREFMLERGVSWPVVFTREDVFNPDYGVSGIPHLTIVDPAGVVRFNAIHPSLPLDRKRAMIDTLLREAGLSAPRVDGG